MAKGVFTHKSGSAYDDRPESFYHFPRTYLQAVEKTVGDWIAYYRPRRGASEEHHRQSYFAIARVARIRNDPMQSDHFYADVDHYEEFPAPPMFQTNGSYLESGLVRGDGKTNKGAFGRSVRLISEEDFERICTLGFAGVRDDLAAEDWLSAEAQTASLISGFSESPAEFSRPIVERLVNARFRAAAFARLVKSAYEDTCAMTGLRIRNGGGRPEVEAAHIRPVANDGPDTLRNGVALCRTAHWMFDRGLVSISPQLTIIVNEKKAPPEAVRLLVPDRKLICPASAERQPHPAYLAFHRQAHGFEL